ncbi:HAD family phosphatase [Curvibacter sp. APW13]|uniref:HAD family hydrolase n=1 Tax=Curvibacter sp. APW13 TaxID=3077236 RepID=UPI0028E068C7|nr:HAD family phosphatase [Curvibacter sp. APW13]MDT8992389.1 HAD family phosphatase [Curvibacter sp. APW13]
MSGAVVRALLIDHDGTLVDSESAHHQLWNVVLAPFGVSITAQEYERDYAGLPALDNGAQCVERFGLAASAHELAQAKFAATRAYLQDRAFPLMPGVAGALAQWRGRFRLGVVTGARSFAVQNSLARHGLVDAFECVVSADDVDRTKPDPACYRLALQRMGLAPEEALAIEDTGHGVDAAADAGVRCLAIPTTLSAGHDFSRACAVLPSMEAAASWISRFVK